MLAQRVAVVDDDAAVFRPPQVDLEEVGAVRNRAREVAARALGNTPEPAAVRADGESAQAVLEGTRPCAGRADERAE